MENENNPIPPGTQPDPTVQPTVPPTVPPAVPPTVPPAVPPTTPDASNANQPVEYKAEDYKFEEFKSLRKEDATSFTEFSMKEKISPELAKKIISFKELENEKQVSAFEQTKLGWRSQLESDLGGKENLKNVDVRVARVFETLDKNGELKGILDLVGVTTHPAIVKFLYALGDKVLEPTTVNPGDVNNSGEKKLKDFLYPNFKLGN